MTDYLLIGHYLFTRKDLKTLLIDNLKTPQITKNHNFKINNNLEKDNSLNK